MTQANDQTLSKEERILRVMRSVLTTIAKETAVPRGMKHPLSVQTIQDMRECLVLITAREKELADQAGRPSAARPRFIDEPRRAGTVTVTPPAGRAIKSRSDKV